MDKKLLDPFFIFFILLILVVQKQEQKKSQFVASQLLEALSSPFSSFDNGTENS
jgi:hypothetical protein